MIQWCVCLDSDYNELFQKVVSYEIISNQMVKIEYKSKYYEIDINKIKEIKVPKYIYNEIILVKNKSKYYGKIIDIKYHFKENKPMYFIEINGHKKSRRYFEEEIIN
jgi:hypothetical protein